MPEENNLDETMKTLMLHVCEARKHYCSKIKSLHSKIASKQLEQISNFRPKPLNFGIKSTFENNRCTSLKNRVQLLEESKEHDDIDKRMARLNNKREDLLDVIRNGQLGSHLEAELLNTFGILNHDEYSDVSYIE